ncbi:MAG TPA: hypothetical protein VF549_13140 [Solirubrobacteraceae bacterium]
MLGPAGTAMAGQDTIVNGNLYPWAQYGPRHSLSSVWTTWFSGDLACANALNDDGSGWAGGSVCASWADTNKGHLYCACQYRKGAGFTAGGYGTAYVRQFW